MSKTRLPGLPRRTPILWLLGLSCVLCAVVILLITLANIDNTALRTHVLIELQLPLLLTATLVGAVLCSSAGCLQVVLQNPLADPGIIGITSGASFVAALLLLVPDLTHSLPIYYVLPGACFAGALLSTGVIYAISKRLKGAETAIILAGISISTMSGAAIGWLYQISDANALRNLTFWLMGNLYQADWPILAISAPIILICLIYQLYLSHALNRLYAGEIAAASSGVSPKKLVAGSLMSCAVGVGAAVAIAGSIAFVGLIVPHLLRLMLGHDNRIIIPAAALMGAFVLLLVVLITELAGVITFPVSMLTASVGGPLLLFALYKGQWRL